MDSGFKAIYFDGIRKGGQAVVCVIDEHSHLNMRDEASGEVAADENLKHLRVLASSVPTQNKILFPNGSYLLANTVVTDRIAMEISGRQDLLLRFVFRLERNKRAIAVSAVAMLVLAILFFTIFLPVASQWIAHRVPTAVVNQMGWDILPILENRFLQATRLETSTRSAIKKDFQRLVDSLESEHSYRLHFYNSSLLGANAFAFPSGDIVLMDDLVELSEHPDEINAVLAHEIGHVEHRHGLQMALNNSVIVGIFTMMTGDFGALSGMAGALPVILIENGYSRRFEYEADAFARDLMIQHEIEIEHFTRFLERLTDNYDPGPGFHYLSTHPTTIERVRRLLEAKEQLP